MKVGIKEFLGVVGLWVTAALAVAQPAAVMSLPRRSASPGLREPVEVRIDRWGVAHIYARNEPDAFFAQGWNAARDRLFQIDLRRRRGLGQLAEVFGPELVDQDRAARVCSCIAATWIASGEPTAPAARARRSRSRSASRGA